MDDKFETPEAALGMAWPQCSGTLLSWLSKFLASSILYGLHLDRSNLMSESSV